MAPSRARTPTGADGRSPWWRDAVIYQVYPRSFADSDGDGIGDIRGLVNRLGYLKQLGVDAIWLNPWYPSPLADGGYDVTDHRAIDPRLGTLDQADALIDAIHTSGLRIMADLVPNHTSLQHPWFQAALAGDPAASARYHIHPGRAGGPPNGWQTGWGRSCWVPLPGPAGRWYLARFGPQQPELNWNNPEVRADVRRTLQFWFDRGVDGMRIDVADGLVKDFSASGAGHPCSDQDSVHDIYREWRALADGYEGGRLLLGEVWVDDPARLGRYVRGGELDSVFAFDLLTAPWHQPSLRAAIDHTRMAFTASPGAPTWVLANHDAVRAVSRYARSRQDRRRRTLAELDPDRDLAQGRRRARAAALLMLALPGAACIFQGEELGLEEVEDLPAALRQDPNWELSAHAEPGRDGCRVPLPWAGGAPPYGFGGMPWLPQPPDWAPLTAGAQAADPESTLALYRAALALRTAFAGDPFRWLPAADGVIRFARGAGLQCAVNVSGRPIRLGPGRILLASGPVDGASLPPDTAAWLAPPTN